MPAAPTPIFIAGTVARNIVPLRHPVPGWSAPTVLVLYFADYDADVGRWPRACAENFTPPLGGRQPGARAKAEASAIFAALLVTAAIAVPPGIPSSSCSRTARPMLDSAVARDPRVPHRTPHGGDRRLLVVRGSIARCARTRPRSLGSLRFAPCSCADRRAGWCLHGPASRSRCAFVFVVAYVAVSIVVDVAPDRFLDYMPKGLGTRRRRRPPPINGIRSTGIETATQEVPPVFTLHPLPRNCLPARREAPAEPATIGHFRDWGFMDPASRRCNLTCVIAGPAVTIHQPGVDGTIMGYAMGQLRPGDVLVVDRCGDMRHAGFGGVRVLRGQGREGRGRDHRRRGRRHRARSASTARPCAAASLPSPPSAWASAACSYVPVSCGGVSVRGRRDHRRRVRAWS